MEIRPHPAFREPTSDQYNGPAEDGSRPGVYLISTWEPEKKSRAGTESTAFHETIPRHHLQAAIALEHAGLSRDEVESEVDRYISWPGQAVGYMVGALEIERLRTETERRLGSRFDIRRFHDQVLEDGTVPMGVLRAKLTRWNGE